MKTYQTTEIARLTNLHPNTVRLYESIGFITPPQRKPNGYRVFTELQLAQVTLTRTALRVPLVQNGLRKLAVGIVRASAAMDFDAAHRLSQQYLGLIRSEQVQAEEALGIARQLLSDTAAEASGEYLSRSEAAKALRTTIDTLRNWEMNGLLTTKRLQNGYRVYSPADMQRLTLIRSLRAANYSLASILRLMNTLSENPNADIRKTLNTPAQGEEILSVCDELLTSLHAAEDNALKMLTQTQLMIARFSPNPTL